MNIPDIPAFTTMQTGTTAPQYFKNEGNNVENNIMIDNNLEENLIITPDFLQELEQSIDNTSNDLQNEFNNKIETPQPDETSFVSNDKYEPTIQPIKHTLTKTGYENPYPEFNKKKSYNIINMFLLEYEGEDTIENNPDIVEIVQIAFNQDFGNLRISFSQCPKEARYNNVLFIQKTRLLVAGTMYSTSTFKALHTNQSFNCTEQLVVKSGEKWETERPIVAIQNLQNDEFYVWITDVVSNKQYGYHFKDWQGKALKHCLEYCYNEGMNNRK